MAASVNYEPSDLSLSRETTLASSASTSTACLHQNLVRFADSIHKRLSKTIEGIEFFYVGKCIRSKRSAFDFVADKDAMMERIKVEEPQKEEMHIRGAQVTSKWIVCRQTRPTLR